MPRAYTMTIGSVLDSARAMMSDARTDVGGYRVSDVDHVRALNEAVAAMVGLVPGLFATEIAHTCVAGARQVVIADRAVAFLDIPGLTSADLMTLNQFAPGWTTATPGAAREFIRLPAEPLAFMVNPPAAGTEELRLRAVQAPVPLSAGDLNAVIPLPEAYRPQLAEYVAGRAEMADDEHVNSNRAGQLMERFAAGVKALGV